MTLPKCCEQHSVSHSPEHVNECRNYVWVRVQAVSAGVAGLAAIAAVAAGASALLRSWRVR